MSTGTYTIKIQNAQLNPPPNRRVVDPYVVLNLGGYMHVGSVSKGGALNPTFKDQFVLRVTDERYIDLEVFDYQDSQFENCGMASLTLDELKREQTSLKIPLSSQNSPAGELYFEVDYKSEFYVSPLPQPSSSFSSVTTNVSIGAIQSTEEIPRYNPNPYPSTNIVAPTQVQHREYYDDSKLQNRYPYPTTMSAGSDDNKPITQIAGITLNLKKQNTQPEIHIQTPGTVNYSNNPHIPSQQQQQQVHQQGPIDPSSAPRHVPNYNTQNQPKGNNTAPNSGFSPTYQNNPYQNQQNQPIQNYNMGGPSPFNAPKPVPSLNQQGNPPSRNQNIPNPPSNKNYNMYQGPPGQPPAPPSYASPSNNRFNYNPPPYQPPSGVNYKNPPIPPGGLGPAPPYRKY